MLDDDDPFGSYGLNRLTLSDKAAFDHFFSTCRTRLSDYTFANTFIWRDSIHLRWRILNDCLCVFANGDGGLTMLFPPLGDVDPNAAMVSAVDLCEAYNAAAGLTGWTRVEYVSSDMLDKLRIKMSVLPMSGDYVYATGSMIDLAGGDLASKRQAKCRFARRYEARTEELAPRHVEQCMSLLAKWQEHAGEHSDTVAGVSFKRGKEIAATAEALYNAAAMNLRGMVLYANDQLIGFTLGEMLDQDSCSILIEKCDRDFVGAAQYIFSEFCRQYWSHTKWCNVGDDWEIPSLAWTKQSYRPAYRLDKHVIKPMRPVETFVPGHYQAGTDAWRAKPNLARA